MYTPNFMPPDIPFDGEKVDISTLDTKALHLLVRRAPTLIYGLEDIQKRKLKDFIQASSDGWATNKLLLNMLAKNANQTTEILTKRVHIKLLDLIWEVAMQGLITSPRTGLGKTELGAKLQTLLFSEKSAYAQSGISVACAVEKVTASRPVFHNTSQLNDITVDLIVMWAVDTVEHTFLIPLLSQVRRRVGRLLAPRNTVNGAQLARENKVGRFTYASSDTLEVTIGDRYLRFSEPKFDDSWALIIALCPTEKRDVETDTWSEAATIKAYHIEEETVKRVINGWSRKALHKRKFTHVPQTQSLEAGEIGIFEIPLDVGPYDADIEVVCVWPDGLNLEMIHFPATFLDAVRTFPDGENRVQVEIKNVGRKPIRLKDIYFRIRLYETDKKTRQKWELRKALQDAEQKWFYAIEHLIYSKVLRGGLDGSLDDHMPALGDLANIDNYFKEEEGMIFYQHEEKWQQIERCEMVKYLWKNLTEPVFPKFEDLMEKRIIMEPVLPALGSWYQQNFVAIHQNVCPVGREKKVIFVCRNDINPEELAVIVKQQRVTDILSVPGKNSAPKPNDWLVQLCHDEKIQLTSIEVVISSTENSGAIYDLVGAKRNKLSQPPRG